MKTTTKRTGVVLTLAAMISLVMPQMAMAAPTDITINGVVYDKNNKPVSGVTVVAFCGGVNFLGGSDATDANGYYLIDTHSEKCPLGTELTVTTDIDGDGLSDGATHTQTHTSTYISIFLGDYRSVVIPEYGWIGASVAALAGIGIIGFMRRSRPYKLSQ